MDESKIRELELALQLGEKPYHADLNTAELGDTLSAGSMPADGLYELWMQTYRPDLVIEVGSFLGYSAIKMAKEIKRLGLKSKIICIDTWQGGAESFEAKDSCKRMTYKHGYPQMYFKFITNVVLNDVHDVIIPLPLPSSVAAKVLPKVFNRLNIKPDFIFLDGSHDERDTYFDCVDYYPMLSDRGVMWGDDWSWISVKTAVVDFVKTNDIESKLKVLDNQVHWSISK